MYQTVYACGEVCGVGSVKRKAVGCPACMRMHIQQGTASGHEAAVCRAWRMNTRARQLCGAACVVRPATLGQHHQAALDPRPRRWRSALTADLPPPLKHMAHTPWPGMTCPCRAARTTGSRSRACACLHAAKRSASHSARVQRHGMPFSMPA